MENYAGNVKPEVKKIKCHRKLYKNEKHRIRIVESFNPLKTRVALICSKWLDSLDGHWYKYGTDYHQHQSLSEVLSNEFPQYTWREQSNQKQFDVFSLDAGIAIGLKTVTGKQKRVITNASIFPAKVNYRDVMTKRFSDYDKSRNDRLDVLFVCINRDVNDNLLDYAIVDGAYWGFTYTDYIQCKEIYTNLNNKQFKASVLNSYLKYFGNNSLVRKLSDGSFGYSIQLNLRTLITLSNPVGRLNVSGWWEI